MSARGFGDRTGDVACEREGELLAALGRGYVGAELESHAAGCVECGALRQVAGALLDSRTAAIATAPIPAAGTMWWRLRIRRRQEAARRARRSILVGQAATLAVALAFALVLFGPRVVDAVRDLGAAIALSTPLLVAFALLVLAAPIAGWVVSRR